MTHSEMQVAGEIAMLCGTQRVRAVEIYENIHAAYEGRAYHNLDHIADMLRRVTDHVALRWAVIFHDIVYEPGGQWNEELSAQVMRATLDGILTKEHLALTEFLILLTKRHEFYQWHPHPDLCASIIDADLWGFISDPEGNAAKIREEFKHVPDAKYKQGRLAWLAEFGERRPFFADLKRESDFGRKAVGAIYTEIEQLGGTS